MLDQRGRRGRPARRPARPIGRRPRRAWPRCASGVSWSGSSWTRPTGAALGPPGLRRRRRRGVLLRPLGDVVVLMPPLTSTGDEIDRVVDVLAECHRRGRRPRTPGEGPGDDAVAVVGGRPPATRLVAEGRWREPRSFDARGHDGLLADRPAPDSPDRWCPSPPTTTSAWPPTRRWWPRPHEALDRWGAGVGGVAPGHRVPARCTAELEAALAAWKGTEAAVVLPTGFAANLGVLSVFGAAGAVVHSDELQPRLDHRRVPAGPGRTSAVYRHCDPGHLDASLARRRRAGGGRVRHRVLHGR